ncbi:Rv1733c family protein [Streptomyces sp. bgisy100]|uniref:Rv1733c family protein n=1 Tax=Streptomyces sp. bgisy100 TaxID=3413783 RepID=UPI003D75FBA6
MAVRDADGGSDPYRSRPANGRNPLVRRADRVESWCAAALVALLFAGVPTASLAVGRVAYASEMHTVRAQAAERHRVQARLTADAEVMAQTDTDGTSRAPVRWTEGNGAQRSGTAGVAPGTAKGSTVRIWVDRTGSVTTAPMPEKAAVATGWAAGFLTAGLVTAWGFGARAALRRLLDRSRYARWEHEWEAFEPQWSRRYHP